NGVVDNGNPSGGAACSTGQQGICAAGTTACTGGAVVCNRNQAPTAETCDGLDNDCNGVVDNGNPSGGAACSTGQLGVCSAGTTACTGGAVLCNRNVNPTTETCDGLDNDCNGVVDNGNPGSGAACSTGNLGICAAGTTSCTAGAIACTQTNTAKAETCDGLDNDCNGVVDNGNPGGGVACSTGQSGICSAGTTACTAGSLACNRNQSPTTETCNGLDDDCNGVVDNGNPGGGIACSTGQLGVCSAGTTACVSGATACSRNVSPTAEVCDGLDNNCNGPADDGVSCAAITASDTSWKQTQSPAAGWQNVSFDDSTWLASVDEGQVPVAPWGAVAMPTGSAAHWIWSYDSRSSSDTQTVYFRKAFVPNVSSETLTITADNSFTVYVNGAVVGTGNNYPTAYTFTIAVNPGVTNVIAVSAVNGGGPGGLIADIRNTDSASSLVTTTAWKQSQTAPAGWQTYAFVDSSWLAAVDETAPPTAPWGAMALPSGSAAHWIWSYDSRSSGDLQTVYFRSKFTATKTSYTLYVTADNSFTAYLNGVTIGTGSNWPTVYSFPVTTVAGTGYALAITAVNAGGPGGLLADLR
ncbi:MAG: putative metal-binding motif-containing protein, partial [Byssovorax sp.]